MPTCSVQFWTQTVDGKV